MLAQFQYEGVSFLLAGVAPRGGGPPARFLCDQQGTGKTVTAAAAAALRPWMPLVVACPAGLRRHWRAELRRHAGRESVVAETAKAADAGAAAVLAARGDPRPALVVSHDNLADALARPSGGPRLRQLLASGPLLVPDEAHRLKGRATARGKAAREARLLAHGGGGASWWLSATPMPCTPLDLWVLLKWSGLDIATFGSLRAFADHFGGATPDGGVTWYWPRTPPGGAAYQLAGYMLRRLRRDVMPELPPPRVEVRLVDVEGAARRTLNEVARAAAASLGEGARELDEILEIEPSSVERFAAECGRRLGELAEARVQVAEAKVPALLRRVAELEAEDRILGAYSEHRAPVEALRGRPGWVVLTGDESDRQRALIVSSFEAGEAEKGLAQWPSGSPVWGIAYTAAGREGFSMRRIERLLVVSSPWNPDDEAQAIDRMNRYGRVTAPIVEKLVVAHPVELATQRVLATKRVRNLVALGDDPEEHSPLSVPAPESSLPFYSYTRLALERDCKFAAHCRYRLGLRPAQHPEYRRLGVLFDVAVSARLVLWAERWGADGGASALGAEGDAAAAAAMRRAAADHAWPQRDGSTEEDGLAALELSRRALHLFGFVSGRWKPYLHEGRPAVQVDLRVPLGQHLQGFAGWRQIVDLVAWDHATPDARPRLAVLDFKCRRRGLGRSLADGQDDPQLMLYMRGCREAGLPVEVAVRLEVLGKVPQEPRRLKKGGLSVDKSQVTTPELFEQAIDRHGLDREEYREHLEWLRHEGPRTHATVQCGRVDQALETVWTDMLYDAYESQRGGRPVRNLRPRPSAPCQSEAWPCEYKEICTGTLSGFSTPEAFADTLVKLGKMRRSGPTPTAAEEQDAEQEEV